MKDTQQFYWQQLRPLLRSGYIRAQTGAIHDNETILEVCKFTQGIVGAPTLPAAAACREVR